MTETNDFFSISLGEGRELLRILSNAISAEDTRKIIRGNSLSPLIRKEAPKHGVLTPDSAPNWYAPPSEQVKIVKEFLAARARDLPGFTDKDIPTIPKILPSKNAVPMLAVYLPSSPDEDGLPGWHLTHDAWVSFIRNRLPKIPSANGITDIQIDLPPNARLSTGVQWRPGIRWIIFRPHTFPNAVIGSTADAMSFYGLAPATTEIINAAALFSRFPYTWHTSNPIAAGLEFDLKSHETYCPFYGIRANTFYSKKRTLLLCFYDRSLKSFDETTQPTITNILPAGLEH